MNVCKIDVLEESVSDQGRDVAVLAYGRHQPERPESGKIPEFLDFRFITRALYICV